MPSIHGHYLDLTKKDHQWDSAHVDLQVKRLGLAASPYDKSLLSVPTFTSNPDRFDLLMPKDRLLCGIEDILNAPSLGLLHRLTAVEGLYLSEGLALGARRDGVTDVFPALQTIFIEIFKPCESGLAL